VTQTQLVFPIVRFFQQIYVLVGLVMAFIVIACHPASISNLRVAAIDKAALAGLLKIV
jgi:hypothetical protein